MSNKNIATAIVALIIVVIGVLIYKANVAPTTGTQDAANPSLAKEATSTASTLPGESASEKKFTVTGKNYSFTPSALTVKQGDKVKITFKNTDGTHDLRIDELNVATKRIKTGQEDTVIFTADKTGTFEFYCSVGRHREMGMKGMLTVEK